MRKIHVINKIQGGGGEVSVHTLGLIPPPCYIFESCCFADSILFEDSVPKFENSNILDHAHSILNAYIVIFKHAQRLIFSDTVDY